MLICIIATDKYTKMQELGDRIYSDKMLRKELCYMCLTHRPLRLVYHISPNRKKIMVCARCIEMNGHEVVKQKS
jgi:superfamily II helicase